MEEDFLSRADAIQHTCVVDVLCLEAFECTVEKLVHTDIVKAVPCVNHVEISPLLQTVLSEPLYNLLTC